MKCESKYIDINSNLNTFINYISKFLLWYLVDFIYLQCKNINIKTKKQKTNLFATCSVKVNIEDKRFIR